MTEAQARCNSRQFAEWMAYYELEPWGENTATWQLAAIGTALGNLLLKGKRGRRFRITDFMPGSRKRQQGQTPAQMLAMARMIAAAYAAKYAAEHGTESE